MARNLKFLELVSNVTNICFDHIQQSSEQRKVSLALCTSKIVVDSLGLRKAAKTATMSHEDMGNKYMWVSICCFCKLKALILSSLPFFPKQ